MQVDEMLAEMEQRKWQERLTDVVEELRRQIRCTQQAEAGGNVYRMQKHPLSGQTAFIWLPDLFQKMDAKEDSGLVISAVRMRASDTNTLSPAGGIAGRRNDFQPANAIGTTDAEAPETSIQLWQRNEPYHAKARMEEAFQYYREKKWIARQERTIREGALEGYAYWLNIEGRDFLSLYFTVSEEASCLEGLCYCGYEQKMTMGALLEALVLESFGNRTAETPEDGHGTGTDI